MSQYSSLNNFLENQGKSIVIQKKSSPINGIIILIIGVIIFIFSYFPFSKTSDFMPYLLLVIASGLIITGILKILIRKKMFISPEYGKLQEKTIGFDFPEKDKLISLLEKGQIEQIKNLKRSVAESLILKVVLTGNCKLCFSQVEHFENYEYVPVSDVFKHKYEDALVLKLLK
jgi:hypothetical protein